MPFGLLIPGVRRSTLRSVRNLGAHVSRENTRAITQWRQSWRRGRREIKRRYADQIENLFDVGRSLQSASSCIGAMDAVQKFCGSDDADAHRLLPSSLNEGIEIDCLSLASDQEAGIDNHAHRRPLGKMGCVLAIFLRSCSNADASSPRLGSLVRSSCSSPSVVW